jgi:hypothetical protein
MAPPIVNNIPKNDSNGYINLNAKEELYLVGLSSSSRVQVVEGLKKVLLRLSFQEMAELLLK